MELDAYRREAEECLSALDREQYLHFSGQRDELAIGPIYDRHAELFTRAAVEALRASGRPALLEFAVQGLIGLETRALDEELARREAALALELGGRELAFRASYAEQANEPDPERRARIEAARDAAIERELDPLLRELLERTHALAGELGWPSAAAMCAELSGIDLEALHERTAALLEATGERFERLLQPQLEAQLGFGFERLGRSDLPAFMRAPELDRWFPAERLVPSLAETFVGLGVEFASHPSVRLDTEPRQKKSPRAFCAPVRVPGEIHLVIAPIGGREDFAALFHEAGHTAHYAHIDPALPADARLLGDNSVTESFAFLFEGLVEEPDWLRRRLGIAEPGRVAAHGAAVKLLQMRRLSAKLAYELELHGARTELDALPDAYARRLAAAVHVDDWPRATWLIDVDPFFYAARYLRAWALEARLRRTLRERFGALWFERPEAGALLTQLWSEGQRGGADALLDRLGGGELDLLSAAPGLDGS